MNTEKRKEELLRQAQKKNNVEYRLYITMEGGPGELCDE